MTRRQWETLTTRLRQTAKAGNAEAQWELGSWLEDGLVDRRGRTLIPPDRRAAVRWYRRSAALGNSSAQTNLGVCLSYGWGVKRNDAEALVWFKRALSQTDPSGAAINIACVYRDRGNNRRALHWYERGAQMGDGDALVEAGARYYAGHGAKSDASRALSCFRYAIHNRRLNTSQLARENAMYYLARAAIDFLGAWRAQRRADPRDLRAVPPGFDAVMRTALPTAHPNRQRVSFVSPQSLRLF